MALMKFILLMFAAYAVVMMLSSKEVEGVIGINWGRQSAQRLVPSIVVDIILQNGVSDVRFYTGREDVLRAFAGAEVNLTITLFDPNYIHSVDSAQKWIHDKIQSYPNTTIRRVIIGDQPFYHGLMLNKSLVKSAMDATMLLQNTLNEMGYGQTTKVTIAHPDGILKDNLTRPSDAEFRDEIKEDMKTLLRFLEENDSPLVVELFPIFYVTKYNFDLSFAFPDNKSTHVVTDINGLVYTNSFEFMYDAFVWAVKKAGVPHIKIMVGQIGWPTDGYPGADVSSAQRFYKSLLPLIASKKGTPMRPGIDIDVNVHALMDENRLPYSYPYARHWGIYRTNGEPKFKIDLTGQGRDIYPTKAAGIMRMPGRWCVYNYNDMKSSNDTQQLNQAFDYACKKSDCTSLSPGGSCGDLDFARNISYAFNMYFQSHFQDERSCDFKGLGKVITDDPSNNTCVFPLEVVKGKQNLRQGSGGCRLHHLPHHKFLIFLSIFILVPNI